MFTILKNQLRLLGYNASFCNDFVTYLMEDGDEWYKNQYIPPFIKKYHVELIKWKKLTVTIDKNNILDIFNFWKLSYDTLDQRIVSINHLITEIMNFRIHAITIANEQSKSANNNKNINNNKKNTIKKDVEVLQQEEIQNYMNTQINYYLLHIIKAIGLTDGIDMNTLSLNDLTHYITQFWLTSEKTKTITYQQEYTIKQKKVILNIFNTFQQDFILRKQMLFKRIKVSVESMLSKITSNDQTIITNYMNEMVPNNLANLNYIHLDLIPYISSQFI